MEEGYTSRERDFYRAKTDTDKDIESICLGPVDILRDYAGVEEEQFEADNPRRNECKGKKMQLHSLQGSWLGCIQR